MSTHSTVDASSASGEALASSLFDGSVADPYPVYEELRELGDGIHWAPPANAFVVCRYDDVRSVASDPGLFSSDLFWDTPQSIHDPGNAEHMRFIDVNSRLFMLSDPPVHTRVRSSFKRAFTPAAMNRWQPLVKRVTAKLIRDYRPGDELDIMPTLAADVPVAVIATILGVPEEKHPRFREWSMAYASTFDPMVQGARRDQVIHTSVELIDYLQEMVTERRRHPTEDLISVLIGTETSTGDYLDDIELLSTLTILLAAGNETTTNVIGSGLAMLIEHPVTKAELMRDSSLIPSAVEEMLRMEPPIHLMFRKTTRETELGEHTIPPNTVLMPCPPAANRDPRRFENPLTFDIRRPDNRHLAFLHGIHFCVGAALARLELAVVFEQILASYPEIAFGSTTAVRRSSNSTVRGWETLPVRL